MEGRTGKCKGRSSTPFINGGLRMPLIWFYHYKMEKRVYIKIPDDVWPDKFKQFAETVTRYHEKITDHFGVNQVAKEVVVKYETAKRYLEILKDYGIVKHSPTLREDSYILACTPEEEAQAERESNASQLAARAFTIAKRVAWNRPLVADILQRRPIRTWLKSRHTILLKEPILR
jgi:hypothetical protein